MRAVRSKTDASSDHHKAVYSVAELLRTMAMFQGCPNISHIFENFKS